MTAGGRVGAADLGGTHVLSACVGPRWRVDPGTRERVELEPRMGRDELLARLVGCVRATAARAASPPGRWGIAVPGPFDYRRGVCLIEGVGKFDALYGVDLRTVLAEGLGARPAAVVFLNDANAFVLGEATAGAAAGHERVMGVTLGTGLGSAFLAAGEIVEDDPAVPAEGRLDLVPHDGVAAEERFSRRGILRSYGADAAVDVVDVVGRARAGQDRAARTMRDFAEGLAAFLSPWVAAFAPTCLVVGGGIARAWDLLEPALVTLADVAPSGFVVVAAGLGEDAHLVGAARWARGGA